MVKKDYEVCDSEHTTIERFETLAEAKTFAENKWEDCWFDGNPELGAEEIYIYLQTPGGDDDEHVGYICYPRALVNDPDGNCG